MLITLSSCDSLTFGSNNNSNSQSINISSQVNLQEGKNKLEKYLKFFLKALNNELDYNYEYYIYSCYDDKSYAFEKLVQKIDGETWYQEDDYVIYNVTKQSLFAYAPTNSLGYIKYEDEDIDINRFSHHSWIEKFIKRFVEENQTYDSETVLYSNYYISSYYETIEDRNALTLYLAPYNKGSREYFKLTLFVENIKEKITMNHHNNFYITWDEYYNLMKEEASKIVFNYEYSLLQKIDEYPSSEKYNSNPGFGIDVYSDKKYECEDFFAAFNSCQEIVFFEVTAYPDCFMSKGQHVTGIYITDKNITFNGLSLNTSKDELISYFMSDLDYDCIFDDGSIYTFSKDGIRIRLVTENDIPVAISFVLTVTNVFNIIY